jgi:hypothetical protein
VAVYTVALTIFDEHNNQHRATTTVTVTNDY